MNAVLAQPAPDSAKGRASHQPFLKSPSYSYLQKRAKSKAGGVPWAWAAKWDVHSKKRRGKSMKGKGMKEK